MLELLVQIKVRSTVQSRKDAEKYRRGLCNMRKIVADALADYAFFDHLQWIEEKVNRGFGHLQHFCGISLIDLFSAEAFLR